MTDRELMQQALHALVYHTEQTRPIANTARAIEALRKRLTQCDRCGKANPAEIHTCTPKKQEPGVVDSDKVICPSCCHQFRAIPVNVQQLMLAAEQEPVAWLDSLDRSQPHAVTGFQYLSVAQIERGEQHKYIPVYAAPLRESGCGECGKKQSDGYALYCVECSKPMREWVGLTDEDMNKLRHLVDWTVPLDIKKFARYIEAKLKEKNS